MLSPSPLSRRSMLKASGAGVLALSLPLAAIEPAAAAPPPSGHPGLQRDAWSAIIGARITVADGPALTLTGLDDLAQAANDERLRGHQEAFVLEFAGPASPQLASAIHEIAHPTLGGIWLFVTPVGGAGSVQRYEAIIDRTVHIPAELDGLLAEDAHPAAASGSASPGAGVPLAAAPPAGAAGAGAAAPLISGAPVSRRRRVHARAYRRHGRLSLDLRFPGGGLQAVSAELRRGGKTVGHGSGAVRGGRAGLTIRARHRLRRGTYALHLTVTDRQGRPTTLVRHLKVH